MKLVSKVVILKPQIFCAYTKTSFFRGSAPERARRAYYSALPLPVPLAGKQGALRPCLREPHTTTTIASVSYLEVTHNIRID